MGVGEFGGRGVPHHSERSEIHGKRNTDEINREVEEGRVGEVVLA